ncbi:hypothetical protein BJY52DRAFT_1194507 [Lactarius psammicola]|nr:hypothetical protein BJY52DRAFT_1194507 [Lactarius psammicola]
MSLQEDSRQPYPAESLAVRTLHGATLQELLRAKNYAILQILHERNELMQSLRGNDTEFPELDFISPPEDGTITYTVMWSGEESHVLRERVRMPSWVQYPGDRRYSDASTQTEDPDATLADIDPPAQDDNNEEGLAIQTLHEAALHDLVHARNYAVLHILHERNRLMRERNTLRGDNTEFPEYNYIGPSDANTLPYMALWIGDGCHVLQFRASKPSWAQYPVDRRWFDSGTQTEDPDTTLVDIEPLAQDDNHVAKRKKVID